MKVTLEINVPAWLKSKLFWTALITILIETGNYFITNNIAPQLTVYIAAGIAVLGYISTAIGGVVNSVRLRMVKAQLANFKK